MPVPLTPSQLAAASACYCLQPSEQMPALLYLGTQILSNGGSSSGTGGVLCGVGPPLADPGISCAEYYDNVGGHWSWNDPLGQWDKYLN